MLLRECREELDGLEKAMKSFLSENVALKKRILEVDGIKDFNEKGVQEVNVFFLTLSYNLFKLLKVESASERVHNDYLRIKELISERRSLEISREVLKSAFLTSQSKLKALLNI